MSKRRIKASKVMLSALIFVLVMLLHVFCMHEIALADDSFENIIGAASDKNIIISGNCSVSDYTFSSGSWTVDLAGNTVTATNASAIKISGATVFFLDSVGSGKITSSLNIFDVYSGTLRIESGEYVSATGNTINASGGGVEIAGGSISSGTGSCLNVSGSSLVIDGGNFKQTHTSSSNFLINAVSSTSMINGGVFTGSLGISSNLSSGDSGSLKINGGTFTTNYATIQCSEAPLTVTGGAFITKNEDFCINAMQCEVTFSGGTVTSGKGTGLRVYDSETLINAGSFKGGVCGAVLYGLREITVTGGSFSGAVSGCAVYNSGTNVQISGGSFSASGGEKLGGLALHLQSSFATEKIPSIMKSGYLLNNTNYSVKNTHVEGYTDFFCCSADSVSVQRGCAVVYNGGKDYEGQLPADPNGAYVNGSTVTVVSTPSYFVKEGYSLTGWSDGKKIYKPGGSFVITGDITLTAIWSVRTFSVTFKDFDGKILGTEAVTYGNAATAPENPKREGFEFIGWSSDYSKITSSVIITAMYSPIKYTVTFCNEDGSVILTQQVEHGQAAVPPKITPDEGITFTGWDGEYEQITKDVTFTAKYEVTKFDVKIGIENITYQGRDKAVYGEDYKVMLIAENGNSLPERLSINIGGISIPEEEYMYYSTSGAVIIPAELVRGNIVISAEGSGIKYPVKYLLTGVSVSGDKNAEFGTEYSAQFESMAGYTLPINVNISVNGVKVASSTYRYDGETGTLVIPAGIVTGEIEIMAVGVVTVNGSPAINLFLYIGMGLCIVAGSCAVFLLLTDGRFKGKF